MNGRIPPNANPPMPVAHTDNVRLAIGSIVLTVFVLAFSDALVKFVSTDFSLWQLYVLRSLFAIPVVIVLLKLPTPGISFRPVRLGWSVLRSVLMVTTWATYYIALPRVAFSVAASVLYTIPIFITLFSALFTGDRVGMKSWFAVAVGFTGVLVIVRPTAEDFNGYALLPLLSAILFAVSMILTRTKCRDENPKILALMQNISFALIGGIISAGLALWQPPELAASNPFVFGDWQPLAGMQWAVVVVLGVTVAIANVCGAFAYQRGPSAIIATFDYTYLVFSLLWGFLLFYEIPDLQSIVGMIMIAASGILIVRRSA